jgi:hypothetical protein
MYFYSYFWLPNVKILWLKNKNLRVNTVDSTGGQSFFWTIKTWCLRIMDIFLQKILFFRKNSPLLDT